VCAPMMLNPFPGAYFSPTANATIELMFLVKKYLPPGFRSHDSFSLRRSNPAAASIRDDSDVAWKDVHDALR